MHQGGAMTDAVAPTLMFLPGASGNTNLWRPISDRLTHRGARVFFGWPGFGDTPPDPRVTGIDDLVEQVARRIDHPVELLAQSMGGLIALRVALRRPALVRHLVLSVTSGGLDVAALGGQDWRATFRQRNPTLPRWFEETREDLTDRLAQITVPTLLLWGDADPISPVAVGQRLAGLLPAARLVVLPGGTHDLVHDRAADVLPHVEAHLAR
jgi:pimeloyl-ACP methyl ester carboxylesterase